MDPVTAKMALQLGVSLAKSKTLRRAIIGAGLSLLFCLGVIVLTPSQIMGAAFANRSVATVGVEAGCLTGTAPASAQWNMEQATNAKTIWLAAKAAGVGDHGAVVGIATAMQESTLRNLDYGDRDSLGLFQQRANWGSAADRQNPAISARLFFAALVKINGWQNLPVTVAAQRVQISAYPDAYAKWVPAATDLVSKMAGTVLPADCTQSTGGGPVPASFDQQGNPRTVAQATAWMVAHPNGAPGEPVQRACERYMNLSYGVGGGYATALAHWNAAGPRSTTGVPPRGSLVFIRSANPAGHVILSLGEGQAVSTDFSGGKWAAGKIGVGSITAIAQAMGGPVLGWRAPNFQVGSGR